MPADKLVQYISDFQKPQEDAGHIKYCHEVNAVRHMSLREDCVTNVEDPSTQCQPTAHVADGKLPRRFTVDVTSYSPCDDRLNAAVKRSRFSANAGVRAGELPGEASTRHVCCGGDVEPTLA